MGKSVNILFNIMVSFDIITQAKIREAKMMDVETPSILECGCMGSKSFLNGTCPLLKALSILLIWSQTKRRPFLIPDLPDINQCQPGILIIARSTL